MTFIERWSPLTMNLHPELLALPFPLALAKPHEPAHQQDGTLRVGVAIPHDQIVEITAAPDKLTVRRRGCSEALFENLPIGAEIEMTTDAGNDLLGPSRPPVIGVLADGC